jgi:glycine oxidase
VVALGPWTGEAERWLGIAMPVEPLKGEILRMQPAGEPPAFDVSSSRASLYRRAGDQVWLGSTQERVGFDKTPSDEARERLWGGAVRLMPSMAEATLLQHTVCLRPVTPDWLPIVGRAPGWENAYLATGAGKKGILLSTGMGKAVADLIADGSTALSIDETRPERFASVAR